MVLVMTLLREIARKDAPYGFVDRVRSDRAEKGVQMGIDCILRCQVIVGGKRTAWCAQAQATLSAAIRKGRFQERVVSYRRPRKV